VSVRGAWHPVENKEIRRDGRPRTVTIPAIRDHSWRVDAASNRTRMEEVAANALKPGERCGHVITDPSMR
jgi:hypothetical protein